MTETPALSGRETRSDGELARVHQQLESDLKRVRESLRALVAPPHQQINEPVMYSVEDTGRLLRPTLVLLSSYLFENEPGITTKQRVIEGAAVVEMLHIATLHHDDLIDEAQVRRGRPTANAKYGDAVALLVGDYLLARCMESAATLGRSRVVAMSQTLTDVCLGQMLESSQLFDPTRTEEDYLASISGKTARLIRMATAMGALQSDSDQDSRDALERFGHSLGMAFQIWDDILDICSEETGKQPAKDIVNGVYTLPVIYAVRDAPDRLLPLLREQPPSDASCREMVSVMRECGAIGAAADLAQRYMTEALDAVEAHPSLAHRVPVVGDCLRGLVDRFASRHPALRALRGSADSGACDAPAQRGGPG